MGLSRRGKTDKSRNNTVAPWGYLENLKNSTFLTLARPPNVVYTPHEISFKMGDILEVLKEASGDGWISASREGKKGDIPESYVKSF